MGQLQDMMMRTMGQPTGHQATQGMVANPQQQQAPQPSPTMQGSPAPPASQFAGRMDPQVLQSIVEMMSATQGGMPPAPSGKVSAGWPEDRPGGYRTIKTEDSWFDKVMGRPGSSGTSYYDHIAQGPPTPQQSSPGRGTQYGQDMAGRSGNEGSMRTVTNGDVRSGPGMTTRPELANFSGGNDMELRQNGQTTVNGIVYALIPGTSNVERIGFIGDNGQVVYDQR